MDELPEPDRPRRNRWVWLAAGGLSGVAAAFVFVWFQPHKLFVDDRVDQPVPTAQSTTTPTTPPEDPPAQPPEPAQPTQPQPPAEPVDLATGSFVSRDHSTSGSVRVLQLPDGQRFVRLEGFATDNGPDLFVYLSTNPAGGSESAFDDDFVNLGRLQGNIGDQNYELPGEVDLGGYASVVVWCDRFDSAFGAADLVLDPSA